MGRKLAGMGRRSESDDWSQVGGLKTRWGVPINHVNYEMSSVE
jgi:hypothetical protein